MQVKIEVINGDVFIKSLHNGVEKSKEAYLDYISKDWFLAKLAETFRKRGARDNHDPWGVLSNATMKQRLERQRVKIPKDTDLKLRLFQMERKSGNVPILEVTAALRNSFRVIKRDDNSTIFGTTLEYAKKHQFGDKSNKFNGKSAPIPKREMLFITKNDEKELHDFLTRMLNENMP